MSETAEPSALFSDGLTILAALQQAQTQGLNRLDAQLLLAELCGQSRSWLIAHDDAVLDATQQQHWQNWLAQRADGVPVAYLLGRHEFHGLTLQVGPAVLDPRPDTETLVDWALERLQARAPGPAPQVLDLGTGSGAVALAIKHGWPRAEVAAVDLSIDALAMARRNGERLGLAVQWWCGNWFGPLPAGRRFELIVSNPPYVREDDPHLAALRHEPRLALTSGADGLDAIRRIVHDAPDWLSQEGWLLLEHGHDQADAVAALLQAAGFGSIEHRLDLAGHRRCTGACLLSRQNVGLTSN